ncbi:MAG TPA: acyl-ACP--UDP-N-acetylglucosamine O-acyltransferase [Polyangiaceae bacterium]|nr:acyl-ACP--UDP-N-acetylglucosamine O-acyltransferase [Polyangiaceae bacterium]
MTARIHPTAVVDPSASLADSVVVGPLCHVGAGVSLGEGTELLAQATVLGPCRIGRRNRIFPHATLGAEPQDRSHAGEPTELVVGDDNVFRESVTVHRGTKKGGGVTRVGSGGLFMVGVHVGHDAIVGDRVTFANYTSLGGHVTVGDRAALGGHVAVAPFVRIGEISFAAGGAMIERDVPPFLIVAGDRARVRGLNHVGLERAAVPEASRAALDRAYRILFHSKKPLAEALRVAREEVRDPYAERLFAAFGRD